MYHQTPCAVEVCQGWLRVTNLCFRCRMAAAVNELSTDTTIKQVKATNFKTKKPISWQIFFKNSPTFLFRGKSEPLS